MLAPVAVFARENAGGRETATLPPVFTGANPWLDDYFQYAHPWENRAEARVEMRSDCTLEPVAMIDATPARASFRVHATWELLVDHRAVRARALTIEPEVIREVAACANAGRDPAAAEVRAAAGLVSLVVHNDVFEEGRGYWVASVILANLEEIEPCVRSAAGDLHAEAQSRLALGD